jgi:hypothetical protein
VSDPDGARQWCIGKALRKIEELTLGTTPRDPAIDERSDARGIVAPIFEAPQPVEQARRNLRIADDADDAAQVQSPPGAHDKNVMPAQVLSNASILDLAQQA